MRQTSIEGGYRELLDIGHVRFQACLLALTLTNNFNNYSDFYKRNRWFGSSPREHSPVHTTRNFPDSRPRVSLVGKVPNFLAARIQMPIQLTGEIGLEALGQVNGITWLADKTGFSFDNVFP